MQRARAGPGRAAAALARGCHTPLVFSLSKDRARNCRLSAGSLMPVLVTLSGNIFGGFCVLTGFLPRLSYAEGKQLCPLVPFARSGKAEHDSEPENTESLEAHWLVLVLAALGIPTSSWNQGRGDLAPCQAGKHGMCWHTCCTAPPCSFLCSPCMIFAFPLCLLCLWETCRRAKWFQKLCSFSPINNEFIRVRKHMPRQRHAEPCRGKGIKTEASDPNAEPCGSELGTAFWSEKVSGGGYGVNCLKKRLKAIKSASWGWKW